MAYRAYVGNLPFTYTKSDLEQLFQPFGVVKSTDIILDRETGRSRGFGFVEMESSSQLAAAIEGLNGSLVNGRPLTVNEARERERSPGGPRGPGGFAPRGPGDRPAFGDRPPRSFDRPAGDRGAGGPPSARPGPSRSDTAPSGPRQGPGPGPDRGGPPKRERAPDRAADRRNPKMDSYEREHKDWRRYNDDDEGWS